MASLVKDIFIVAAKRTPFGTFGGKLVNKSCVDLAEIASKAALEAGGVDPKIVDSVCIGNVISASSADAYYIARHVALRLGIPIEVPALVINRLCGSGIQSIVNGIHDITMGDAKVVLTGGSENMSQSPFALRSMRFGTKLGTTYNADDVLWNALTDLHCKTPMGVTAENLAAKFKLTREEIDEYSYNSQQKWKKAHEAGYFKQEITPVNLKFKGKDVVFDVDEHPRPDTPMQKYGKLATVFKKDGVITAANSSGINDGAGAVIIASEAAMKEHNLKPLARIVAYSIAGVDPKIMGFGPVPCIKKILAITSKTLADIDLIEINEAFGAQVLACQKDLQIDSSKLNVNGGAIAVGHPLAASGSRVTAHLMYELKRRGAKLGIASACIGGGQGIAILLESV